MFRLSKVWIEFFEDFLTGLLNIHVKILENPSGYAVTFAKQTEKYVLRSNKGMV